VSTEDDIRWQCEGAHCRVGLTRKVSKTFERLDAKIRAGLSRWMGIFAKEGGTNIPPERFKYERRVKGMDEDIAVYVFKEWQTRLYGAYVTDEKPTSFLVTEIDDAKKQNKADPACIERAARVIGQHIAVARKKRERNQ
jgi:hypothetical protein